MSLIKKLTQAALTASVEDMEEEVQPIEGQLEEQILEVVEAQIEAEQNEEAVQQLETTAVALEAFAYQLESMQAKGNSLSKVSARVMQIGVESLVSSVGYEGHKHVGLEEFEGETDSVQATDLSLEGLKETLMAIWKGIKEAVARAVAAVKAFLGKIFNSVDALDARARRLAIDAQKVKGQVKAGAKLSLPGSVSFKGEASVSAIKVGLKATASAVESTAKSAGSDAKTYYSALAKAAADVAEKKEIDTDAIEKQGQPSSGFDEDLLGGKKVKASPKGIGYVVEGGEGKSAEVEVPSKADIKEIATGVRAVVAAVKAQKAAVAAIDAEQAAALKAAEGLIAASDKKSFGKMVDQAKARWVMTSTRYSFTSSLSKVAGIAVKGAYAAVIVGEKAVKQYGSTAVAKA